MAPFSVHVIGKNRFNELSTQHVDLKTLTKCPESILSTKITQIVSGDGFAIYCDKDYKTIITSGYLIKGDNTTGFKAINFFNENNIKIRKICANPFSFTVFWITDIGTVYGLGENQHYQLGLGADNNDNKMRPVLIPGLTDVIDIQPARFYPIALCSGPVNLLMLQLLFGYGQMY